MILRMTGFDSDIHFEQGETLHINVKSKGLFIHLIQKISRYCKLEEGMDHEIQFLSSDKNIPWTKISYLPSAFLNCFELKRAITAIHKKVITSIYNIPEDTFEIQEHLRFINTIIQSHLYDFNLPINTFGEIGFEKLLKSFEIQMFPDSETLLDNIYFNVDLESFLEDKSAFIFIDLSRFILEDELMELCKYFRSKQISLINIEYDTISKYSCWDHMRVITEDFELESSK